MLRILLVEPDRILSRVYSSACNEMAKNARITTVSSVEEAIHTVDTQKLDLIIIELLLAHHNGVEFLYELRSYVDLQDIPVVVLSWVPKEELFSSTDAQLFNIKAYLHKPQTTLAKLTETVKQITSQVVAT